MQGENERQWKKVNENTYSGKLKGLKDPPEGMQKSFSNDAEGSK